MTKKFPLSFNMLWKETKVKAAFVTDIEGGSCKNCGGEGYMFTFVAYRGPFVERPRNVKEVIHFADGKWWIGENFSDLCPVCQ